MKTKKIKPNVQEIKLIWVYKTRCIPVQMGFSPALAPGHSRLLPWQRLSSMPTPKRHCKPIHTVPSWDLKDCSSKWQELPLLLLEALPSEIGSKMVSTVPRVAWPSQKTNHLASLSEDSSTQLNVCPQERSVRGALTCYSSLKVRMFGWR